tara:strand:+ start:117 stop:473 length:357 start_codon:yes stop_codon:yes gene_type:complete
MSDFMTSSQADALRAYLRKLSEGSAREAMPTDAALRSLAGGAPPKGGSTKEDGADLTEEEMAAMQSPMPDNVSGLSGTFLTDEEIAANNSMNNGGNFGPTSIPSGSLEDLLNLVKFRG